MGKRIVEDVGSMTKVGLTVYDSDARRLGYVDYANGEQGWMEIAAGEVELHRFWVPYRLIKSVDEREIFLSAPKDEPGVMDREPPRRKTHIVHRNGTTIAITTEPSGYDCEPIVVSEVDLGHVRQLLAVDQRVWTADDTEIGRIKDFDATAGWLLIERGVLSRRHDLIVPVHLVGRVDRDRMAVTLAIRAADLKRMQHVEPVDVVIDLPAMPGR